MLRLKAGCEAADEGAVRATLGPAATVTIDDGEHPDAQSAVRGSEAVTGTLLRLFADVPDLTVTEQSVNGESGLVFRGGGRVVGVLTARLAADRIRELWIVVNPDKLRHWNAPES